LSLSKKETTSPPFPREEAFVSQIDEHKLVRDASFYGTTAIAGDHFLSSSIARVPERKGNR
jgi:hypothetical protein